MLHEYERLYADAVSRHGARVVLFMQVGSFFEMYWREGTAGAASADAARERLNLAIMKHKDPEKPLCTGFPLEKADEKAGVLLDDGWTVCLAEQISAPDTNGRARRELTRCLSPSMRPEARDRDGRSGNYAACVLCRNGVVGAAFIDVGTGLSLVTDGDGLDAAAESRNVTEAIFIGPDGPRQFTGLPATVHDRTGARWTADERAVLSDVSVRDLLAQAYGRGPILTEDMLLLGSRPECRDALAYLLHWTRRHSLALGIGLPRPEIFESGRHVRFSPHALQQLGILKLDGVLNRASTPPGKRRFRHRLCTPYARPADVEEELALVDAALKTDVDAFRAALARTGDLERLTRRVLQSTLPMASADQAAAQIRSAMEAAKVAGAKAQVRHCHALLDALAPVTESDTPFEDDEACVAARNDLATRRAALDAARAAIHPDARLECSADGNHRLMLTKTRYKSLDESLKNSLTATALSGGMRLWNSELGVLADAMKDAEAALKELLDARWADLLEVAPVGDLVSLSEWARDADVTYTAAWNARRMGHVRPTVVSDKSASVRVTGLGNPVAEAAMESYTQERYVRNDVTLDDETQHVLLYGLNSCGKSSVLRGLGMAIVLAQAGMYARCESLQVSPFTRVDTRILTPDDVERGLSSFTAELVEAREALARAGPTSLLLADEIFSSTEWRSGTALVGTMICHVGDKGSRTFVTTHFHELLDHSGIKNLRTLRVAHLSMRVTDAGLTFERKLRDGPCSPSYGIMVAGAYGFDAKFIREATAAREMIAGVPEPRRSRYNSKVVVSKCEACGRPATDSHHIRHRADAVDGRHDDGVPEHHVSNLMALCEACHRDAHRPGADVVRVHTLAGPAVVVKSSS
jgi:DNA mismatch repair protein MutS